MALQSRLQPTHRQTLTIFGDDGGVVQLCSSAHKRSLTMAGAGRGHRQEI